MTGKLFKSTPLTGNVPRRMLLSLPLRRKMLSAVFTPQVGVKCLAKWNPSSKDASFYPLERMVTSDRKVERKATVEMYLY